MTKILAVPGEGERLDRFELVAELAAGGMATVYLARFVGVAGFKRFVAIKRLHPHLAKEQDFIQMFLDEARLAARLHHPNVVPILEIGVQKNEQYYLVMEYIEGDTVGHLMARAQNVGRKIPVPIVVRVMLDTLTGLNAAHELTDDDGTHLEIVHRDVSPQNILVGVDGVARITDFGVAKAQARLANATQGGQLKGKLAYMSPEQVRGNMPVDRRADVFAAGIVLWELLAAQRLFKADGEAETLFKVVAAEVPPLRNFEPGVPPEVEVVIRRALAAHPADRFATTADFAEALEQAARTYNLVATVRQTAAFVNEMIGLDISQQREIVRAWLGRSDVSKSGVARTLERAPMPPEPAPAAASSGANLAGLDDDDLDMATRVDDEEDATRIQQLPDPSASGASRAVEQPPQMQPQMQMNMQMPPAPVMSVGGEARQQYVSVATAREFNPMAALPAMPPAPVIASGPVGWPPPQQQPVVAPPPPGRGLPIWTLLIPAVIIIGGAVFLGLRQNAANAVKHPPPPATTSAAPRETTPTTTSTSTSTSTSTTTPTTPTATEVTAHPIETLPVATATATVTATATATHTARPAATWVVKPKPTNPTAVDNKEFGGRK